MFYSEVETGFQAYNVLQTEHNGTRSSAAGSECNYFFSRLTEALLKDDTRTRILTSLCERTVSISSGICSIFKPSRSKGQSLENQSYPSLSRNEPCE